MKSKTSYFNKTIFKKNITHYWPIWGIILLWNLFVLPFMIYNTSLQYRYYSANMSQAQMDAQRVNDIISLLQVYMQPVILFVFSIAAVMAVFSYLNSARTANTFHALPVTRLELFLTNYISGLLFLIVPEAVGFLTGTLVSAACGYTSINYLFTGFLFACGISFFFYSFTVFIAMFTGQLFAVPVFSLILNFLFVGSKLIISAIVDCLAYGISWGFTGSKMDVLSPLYYFVRWVGVSFDYSGEYVTVKQFTGANIVAGYAVVALVMIAAAYYVYRKRNIETAGSLISIPWICPIFRWGAAFCGGTLLGLTACSLLNITSNRGLFWAAVLFSSIFGAVCFFCAQMFLEKGFRVFQKKRFVECGVFVVVLFGLMTCIECDLFGQEKKMPNIAEVEKAFITNPYTIGGGDSERISQVLDIHSQMISSKKEFEAYAEDRWQYGEDIITVSVKYYLKDGSKLQRSYGVPAEKEMLMNPDTVAGKLAALSTEPDVYLDNLFGGDYQNVKIESGTFDFYGKDGEYEDHALSEQTAEKIYQAVIEDVKAGNFKESIINGFRYDDMMGLAGQEYYNTITLRFSIDMPKETHGEQIRREYNVWSNEGSAYISFHKGCEHVIEALIETGVIESEEELRTREDMERLNE